MGTRISADQPKQFLKIRGIPIIVYSLAVADSIPKIDEIIVNYPDGWREETEQLIKDYAIKPP